MDDDNLNSNLVCKSKKRQKCFLHGDLIILQQEQIEAQWKQEERNRMFFREIMEKERETEAKERGKKEQKRINKDILFLNHLFY